MKESFAVVMAGGSGTRFWPRSRRGLPKHLLDFWPGKSLLQATLERLPPEIDRERTLIITNESQVDMVRQQVDLPRDNIVGEPVARDTAACVGLAARLVESRSPGAVMIALPADHVVEPTAAFHAVLARAVAAARSEEALVTLGVEPRAPATGYGYIEVADRIAPGLSRVRTFTEKPKLERAEEFVATGRYLWNSGIFVWRAAVLLGEMERQLPELFRGLGELDLEAGDLVGELERVYPTLPKISVDFGVMQRAHARLVVTADFQWDDVGSFAAVARHRAADGAGNTCFGDVICLDSKDCVLENHAEGVLATLGVSDLIVVRVGDAVLVAARDQAERVKEIVARLESDRRDSHL